MRPGGLSALETIQGADPCPRPPATVGAGQSQGSAGDRSTAIKGWIAPAFRNAPGPPCADERPRPHQAGEYCR